MRVWEVDNNAAEKAGLVLERDFILRVRRMHRLGLPCLVLNFVLNAVGHLTKTAEALEAIQKKLQEFAALTKGTCAPMSNGDFFIVWEQAANVEAYATRIVESILPEHSADASKFLLTYHMPNDYVALRERTNHYVEVARAAPAVVDGAQVDGARGPLTAKNLDQIGQLLGELNLKPYTRTQSIYRHDAGRWNAIGEEYFISFEDLRRERFPKLELVSSEHFFQSLCGMVDQRLLTMLTNNYELIGGRTLNLNLSMSTISGAVFNQFVHRVPRPQRGMIGFELHRGDLLQDFSQTLSSIISLHREGFRVALDGVTPDMTAYVDLAAFKVDSIKINVSKDRALQLTEAPIRSALAKLPADKLIFYRCDNESALKAGLDLGVKVFQGWLIDDIAGKKV